MRHTERICQSWNKEHPIGTTVSYESIKGDPKTRRTAKIRNEAFVADSGTPVIFLEGVSGYVALDHCQPVRAHASLQDYRTTTLEQYMAEATRRFGTDKLKWKFVCPCCHYVASAEDYKKAGAPEGAVGFSCIGRWLGPKRGCFEDGEGPCDYAGGGLICISPVTIEGHGSYFELAEEA